MDLFLHNISLSCDELTLSVCGAYEDGALSLIFYDIRNFVNQVTSLEHVLVYYSFVKDNLYY